MRRVGLWMALGVLGMVVVPAQGAQAPAKGAPLETLLPADVWVNVSWTGLWKHRADYRKTVVYTLIKHPDVKAFFSKLFHSAGRAIVRSPGQKHPKEKGQLQDLFKLSRVALHGELDIAVGFTMAGPQMALLLRPPADEAEAADKLLTSFLKGIARPAPAEEGQQPDPNKMVIGPDMPLRRSKIDDVHVITIGAGMLEKIEAVAGGEAVSLMKDPVYSRAHRKTGGTKSISLIYIGVKRILAMLRPMLPPQAGAALDHTGLSDLNAVGWSVGFEDRGMTTYMYLDMPAPRKGLFKMADGEPISLQELRVAPPDAHFLMTARCNARKTFDMLVSLAKKTSPQKAPKPAEGEQAPPPLHPVDKAIQKLEKDLGFKIREDLLDSLGDAVVLYSSRSDGMFITGLTLAIPVKDMAKFKSCGHKLLAKIGGGLKKRAGVVMDRVKVEPTAYHMRVIRVPGNCPFTPTVAVSNKYLFASLYPQGVKAALRRAGKLPAKWTPPAGFAEARKHLPERLLSMRYVDPEGAFRVITALLPVIGSFVWDDLEKAGVDFDVALIPPIGEITKDLFPNIAGGYVDDEGITMKSYASVTLPLPGGLLSVGAVAGLSGYTVWNLQTKARVSAARAQVQQGAVALEMYRTDLGAYPTTAQGLNALIGKPEGQPKWKGPYLRGRLRKLKDPWGQALQYRCPGRCNKDAFDLWSMGPDGKDGSGDEVGNWRAGAGRLPKATKKTVPMKPEAK